MVSGPTGSWTKACSLANSESADLTSAFTDADLNMDQVEGTGLHHSRRLERVPDLATFRVGERRRERRGEKGFVALRQRNG